MRRREFMAVLGAAAAWPLATQAQPTGKVYRIALVHPLVQAADMSETGGHPFFRALFSQLRRLGYVERQNLVVERYSGQGRAEHYAELARDVVRSSPDLIYTVTPLVAQHFKAATTTIPIVGIMSEPVAFGIVASLARPGGNITGIVPDAGLEIHEKYFELLREAVPRASKVGYLSPRDMWESVFGSAMRDVAQRLGLSLVRPPLDPPLREEEYRRAFVVLVQDPVDVVIVSNSAENYTHRQLIIGLAEQSRMPAMYPERLFVEAGGLMSYGADYRDLYRHAAGQIDQIFKGAKPGEIPFFRPTKFELVINLKTARALGLDIPPSLLARADEVIE